MSCAPLATATMCTKIVLDGYMELIVAFPMQQWLRERATVLRCT